MKAKIRLDTMKDINQFVSACTCVKVPVYITDGAGLKVSAKSVLGRNVLNGICRYLVRMRRRYLSSD